MRVEGNVFPDSLLISKISGELAEVVFTENVEELERGLDDEETEIYYKYDMYRVVVPYRDNLYESIVSMKEAWIAKAKADEIKEKPLSLSERVADLKKENSRLKQENEAMGDALEEVIMLVLGGMS